MNSLALVRLLQLGSQALPVGGYSHSQGLESAVEHRRVTDEAGVFEWLSGALAFSMMPFEVPMLLAFGRAWARGDSAAVTSLNDEFVAARETAELRAATVQMGYSMRSLMPVWPDMPAATVLLLQAMDEPAMPCVWSAAAAAWAVEPRDSAVAYVWSWAENQVLAAIKTLPLGQSAGQRLLAALGRSMAGLLAGASTADRAPASNFTPGLAILSARHETQYSRLFRS